MKKILIKTIFSLFFLTKYFIHKYIHTHATKTIYQREAV